MTATYEPAHPHDRDLVRFLVGDTSTSNAAIQDEEIDALLAAEAVTGRGRAYLVAATVLSVLHTRWASSGKGIVEKWVDELRIRRGVADDSSRALELKIKELRATGAALAGTDPYVFKVL